MDKHIHLAQGVGSSSSRDWLSCRV